MSSRLSQTAPGAADRARTSSGTWLLFGVVWASPLLVRVLLWSDGRLAPGLPDTLGVVSDAAVSLLFLTLMLWIGRGRAIPTGVLLLLWAGLHYASYEHVRELDAGLQFSYSAYLLDPTFLLGSALRPSRPLVLAIMLVGSVAAGALSVRRLSPRRPGWPWVLAAVGTLFVVSWLPLFADAADWRRQHFAQSNLRRWVQRRGDGARTSAGSTPVTLRADLDGRPRLELPVPGSNVLLVILEGIPGPFVRAIAAAGGVSSPIVMPALSELANRGLTATSFALHQRQTNRGVYSLLCGDLPRLGTALARMTEHGQVGGPDCLPQVLGRAGYRTVYVQGAPLSFMMKDRFLTKAGFEVVEGEQAFDQAFARSRWGVDDRSVMRRAFHTIEQLERGPDPWFLALLTVGTHHPFTIPDTLRGGSREGDYLAAVAYLDDALGELIASLEGAGLLEDTLVIVTADESRGLPQSTTELTRRLSQNWGPLVVLEPGRYRTVLSEPLGQADIALSVLDYLGIDASPTKFIGRSLFRQYDRTRPVYFSNTLLGRTGAVTGNAHLYYCDEPARQCEKYAVESSSLFGEPRSPLPFAEDDLAERGEVVAYSLSSEWSARPVQSYDLTLDREVRISGIPLQQVIGGTNLYVQPNTRIEVELELECSGPRGRLSLAQILRTRERVLVREDLPALSPGDRLRVSYVYDTRDAIDNLKCVLLVLDGEGTQMTVRLNTATVTLGPRPETDGTGLETKPVIEIDRSGS